LTQANQSTKQLLNLRTINKTISTKGATKVAIKVVTKSIPNTLWQPRDRP